MKAIPYGRQDINSDDLKAVTDALLSDYLTQGPCVNEFEKHFAKYIGSKYAVAVANGTAALHLAVLALNLKEGEKVITTPITFAATANCVKYVGADIVFCDINPQSYLIDLENVRSILKSSPKGTFKGVIPVDFAGRAVNLEEFRELANEFGLWIIEDACHSPGGYFIDSKNKLQKCGNGQFADLAIFSFHPVKHIACGEGGMITTNDKNLYDRLLKLRSHGITRLNEDFSNDITWAIGGNKSGMENYNYPGWYMEMQELGFNYRLTDFQAALGSSQLKRADYGLKRRQEIAIEYAKYFEKKNWIKSQSGYIDGHAYHLYIIEVENRYDLYNYLKSKNIYAQVHYIPTHLMPYYKKFGWKIGDMPCAEEYYKGCISLPIYPTLTNDEQNYVITTIQKFYEE